MHNVLGYECDGELHLNPPQIGTEHTDGIDYD